MSNRNKKKINPDDIVIFNYLNNSTISRVVSMENNLYKIETITQEIYYHVPEKVLILVENPNESISDNFKNDTINNKDCSNNRHDNLDKSNAFKKKKASKIKLNTKPSQNGKIRDKFTKNFLVKKLIHLKKLKLSEESKYKIFKIQKHKKKK